MFLLAISHILYHVFQAKFVVANADLIEIVNKPGMTMQILA
jgi:hypothetical protein